MNPRLLAEKLDNLPRVRARLAERDPAVLSQLELLALQHHLQLVVDGDEGAVRAVVPQHELVLAPLDGAMLSRGLVIGDHELAGLIAPEHDRFTAAPPHDVLAPMHQAQPPLRRAQQRDGLGDVGDIGALRPQQLDELDFIRPPCASTASRSCCMQTAISSAARESPAVSYSRVLPVISANRTVVWRLGSMLKAQLTPSAASR